MNPSAGADAALVLVVLGRGGMGRALRMNRLPAASIGLVFAVLYWLIDTEYRSLLAGRGSFWTELVSPPLPVAFARGTVALLLLAVAVLSTEVTDQVAERRREETALEVERDRAHLYLATAFTAMIAIDDRGIVTMANPAACRLLGRPERLLVGRPWYDEFMPAEDGRAQRMLFAEALEGRAPLATHGESTILDANDLPRVVTWSAVLLRAADGNTEGILLSIDDVTHERVRDRDLRLRTVVLDNIEEAVVLHRPNGKILFANRAAWQGRGLAREEFMRLPAWGWMRDDIRGEVGHQDVGRRVLDEGEIYFESATLTSSGDLVPIEVHSRLVEVDGRPAILSSGRDISDRKEHEAKFQLMAFYDELTGIANRALFLDRLRVALAQSARSGRPLAVLFMDLDDFKHVNDTLGHVAGDEALRAVASRLAVNMREGDTLARLGGDEFTFVLPDIETPENAERAAAKLLSVFREPFEIAGRQMRMSASMGISVVTGSEATVEEALARADAAMYRSKEDGRSGWRFYRDSMRASVTERFGLRNRVHAALEADEFLLYFQPQLSARTGRVVGAEAFARWNHPDKGLLLPGEFLDLVEEAGMLDSLGLSLLRIACEMAKPWIEGPVPDMRISMNVAPRQIFGSSFCRSIEEVLAQTGFDPQRLQIEVDEGAIQAEPDYVHSVFDDLHGLGMTVAIDHFGTGFNSLERLRHAPVDCIKINRSFTADVEQQSDAAAITNTVVTLAHHLGLEVVAEGIERPSQAAFLTNNGVDTLQGFLFCEPLPPAALTDLLGSQHRFIT